MIAPRSMIKLVTVKRRITQIHSQMIAVIRRQVNTKALTKQVRHRKSIKKVVVKTANQVAVMIQTVVARILIQVITLRIQKLISLKPQNSALFAV